LEAGSDDEGSEAAGFCCCCSTPLFDLSLSNHPFTHFATCGHELCTFIVAPSEHVTHTSTPHDYREQGAAKEREDYICEGKRRRRREIVIEIEKREESR
jgi:hypothetical protein